MCLNLTVEPKVFSLRGRGRLTMTDRKLIQLVTRFRAGILEGRGSRSMCFAVCAPLAGYLGFFDIQAKIVEGVILKAEDDRGSAWETNHFWLELPDGRVLDPTADQFNDLPAGRDMPKVYLGARPAWYLRTDSQL